VEGTTKREYKKKTAEMKRVFITFADKKLSPTLKRIKKEAKDSGFFDAINVFNEDTFDSEFWKQHGDWIRSNPRGFGYWIWKPYLIQRELSKMDVGDILVYLDAGCVINKDARKRYDEYLEMLTETKPIICFDHERCFEKQYCKSDLLAYLDLLNDSVFLNSKQKMSGLLIIKKSEVSKTIINSWYQIMAHNTFLIDDTISGKIEENSEFIDHRHDQSVFSALCYQQKENVIVLPQKEVYQTPCDASTMSPYPFWAARRKLYKERSFYAKILSKLIRISF